MQFVEFSITLYGVEGKFKTTQRRNWMNSKKLHITKIYTVSTILMIAALLLTACSAISFQGQAQPNSNGGITISGGAQAAATIQPLTTTQPENPQPQTTSQPASGNVS